MWKGSGSQMYRYFLKKKYSSPIEWEYWKLNVDCSIHSRAFFVNGKLWRKCSCENTRRAHLSYLDNYKYNKNTMGVEWHGHKCRWVFHWNLSVTLARALHMPINAHIWTYIHACICAYVTHTHSRTIIALIIGCIREWRAPSALIIKTISRITITRQHFCVLYAVHTLIQQTCCALRPTESNNNNNNKSQKGRICCNYAKLNR